MKAGSTNNSPTAAALVATVNASPANGPNGSAASPANGTPAPQASAG